MQVVVRRLSNNRQSKATLMRPCPQYKQVRTLLIDGRSSRVVKAESNTKQASKRFSLPIIILLAAASVRRTQGAKGPRTRRRLHLDG